MQWNENVFSTTLGVGGVPWKDVSWPQSDSGKPQRGGGGSLHTVYSGSGTLHWWYSRAVEGTLWGSPQSVRTRLARHGAEITNVLSHPRACHCATVWDSPLKPLDAPLQYYMCLSCRTGRRGWLPYLRRVCAPTVGGKEKFSANLGKSLPEYFFRSCTNKASYCRQSDSFAEGGGRSVHSF